MTFDEGRAKARGRCRRRTCGSGPLPGPLAVQTCFRAAVTTHAAATSSLHDAFHAELRMTDPIAPFNRHRPRLYGIAYRMLGSRADAEDMVQETYLRWHRADRGRVQTPEAWLVTTVTRLCIDRLRAMRSERDAYVGPWLPEPLVENALPADAQAELSSDLSVAFLVVLERLAPEERAAFLLHDVFDSPYREIARILGKNQATCRQMVHRARERVHRDRPRFAVSEAARTRLLERFLKALHAGDKDALLTLFAEDATWPSDGGGKARAALKTVRGAELVARFVSGIWRRYLRDLDHCLVPINGETGIVGFAGERPVWALTVESDGAHILAAFAVVNPDKLEGIARKS
jgi:RNA polymerase sigma-70 factor (ECF subfamily)